MIIGTEFLDHYLCAIRCMEGVVETTSETVRILGRNRPTFDAAEAYVDKRRSPGDKTPYPRKEGPPGVSFEPYIRFAFLRLPKSRFWFVISYMVWKHEVFVNHRLKLTQRHPRDRHTQAFNRRSCQRLHRSLKHTKNMVLGNAKQSQELLIPVD